MNTQALRECVFPGPNSIYAVTGYFDSAVCSGRRLLFLVVRPVPPLAEGLLYVCHVLYE
jgi:hypothetical protein